METDKVPLNHESSSESLKLTNDQPTPVNGGTLATVPANSSYSALGIKGPYGMLHPCK
jgi:hypothetical protein